jgi:hypothetical protein
MTNVSAEEVRQAAKDAQAKLADMQGAIGIVRARLKGVEKSNDADFSTLETIRLLLNDVDTADFDPKGVIKNLAKIHQARLVTRTRA